MIRDHFPNQQFIIVSLKKELFQNANVLFETSFSNNKSNVERKELNNKQKKDAQKQ